ncbi:hypothetical protein VPH35_128334 [Triticum aestivum]
MAAAVVVSGIPRSSWWIRTSSAPWGTLAPTFPSPSLLFPPQHEPDVVVAMANLDCVLLVVLAGKELVQKIRLPLLLLLRGSVRAGRLRIAGIEPIFNLRSPPFDASIRASPIVPGLVEPSTSFSTPRPLLMPL